MGYGILSGPEIIEQCRNGNIVIEPFDAQMVGPNSLDVRLGNKLIELPTFNLFDLTKPIPKDDIVEHAIGKEGFILERGTPYLGHTIESIYCKNFVPWLDTRSTLGRYFVMCHMTAGRGDVGWQGTFTMEIMAMAARTKIYAGLPVAQISFVSIQGRIAPYQGRYNGQTGPRLPSPLSRPL